MCIYIYIYIHIHRACPGAHLGTRSGCASVCFPSLVSFSFSLFLLLSFTLFLSFSPSLFLSFSALSLFPLSLYISLSLYIYIYIYFPLYTCLSFSHALNVSHFQVLYDIVIRLRRVLGVKTCKDNHQWSRSCSEQCGSLMLVLHPPQSKQHLYYGRFPTKYSQNFNRESI